MSSSEVTSHLERIGEYSSPTGEYFPVQQQKEIVCVFDCARFCLVDLFCEGLHTHIDDG